MLLRMSNYIFMCLLIVVRGKLVNKWTNPLHQSLIMVCSTIFVFIYRCVRNSWPVLLNLLRRHIFFVAIQQLPEKYILAFLKISSILNSFSTFSDIVVRKIKFEMRKSILRRIYDFILETKLQYQNRNMKKKRKRAV